MRSQDNSYKDFFEIPDDVTNSGKNSFLNRNFQFFIFFWNKKSINSLKN